MNKKLAVALLAIGCVSSVATSRGDEAVMVSSPDFPDTADGCDDPFPALCVTTLDAEGEEMVLDAVEIRDADQALVEDIACGDSTCCSYDLDSGSYVVVVEFQGETLAEPVVVDNSHACDHEVTELTLQFGQAE
jgi:hypothetical protein